MHKQDLAFNHLQGEKCNQSTSPIGKNDNCWVSKMVIPVYGVSEGEALCDWIYYVMSQIQNLVRQIPSDVP